MRVVLLLAVATLVMGILQAAPADDEHSICATFERLDHLQITPESKEVVVALEQYSRNPGGTEARQVCVAQLYSYRGATRAVVGRLVEGEADARTALQMLSSLYPADNPMLARPLHTLGQVLLQTGRVAEARKFNRRLQAVRLEQLEDRQLAHTLACSLNYIDRKMTAASAECRQALADLTARGPAYAHSSDAGALENCLAVIHTDLHQFAEAQTALDREAAILAAAKDWLLLDYVRLYETRGYLYLEERQWQDAEREFHQAVSLADSVEFVPSNVSVEVLDGYAMALRKLHRPAEAKTMAARANASRHKPEPVVDISELTASRRR